jgi:hypothetical protein
MNLVGWGMFVAGLLAGIASCRSIQYYRTHLCRRSIGNDSWSSSEAALIVCQHVTESISSPLQDILGEVTGIIEQINTVCGRLAERDERLSQFMKAHRVASHSSQQETSFCSDWQESEAQVICFIERLGGAVQALIKMGPLIERMRSRRDAMSVVLSDLGDSVANIQETAQQLELEVAWTGESDSRLTTASDQLNRLVRSAKATFANCQAVIQRDDGLIHDFDALKTLSVPEVSDMAAAIQHVSRSTHEALDKGARLRVGTLEFAEVASEVHGSLLECYVYIKKISSIYMHVLELNLTVR